MLLSQEILKILSIPAAFPEFLLQGLHLADHYRDDENIRVHVKMLLALSFVPSVDLTNAFEMLVENCLREIGRQRRNHREESWFAIPPWNVRDRVTDDLPKTNNSVEPWHRSFQQLIVIIHLSSNSSASFEKNGIKWRST